MPLCRQVNLRLTKKKLAHGNIDSNDRAIDALDLLSIHRSFLVDRPGGNSDDDGTDWMDTSIYVLAKT